MMRMPCSLHPAYSGMMWPPQSVNKHSTPAAFNARAARIPPWTGDMGAPRRGGTGARYHTPGAGYAPRNARRGARRSALPVERTSGIPRTLVADEVGAAVVAPGGLVVSLHRGARLAEAHRRQGRTRHAEIGEVTPNRGRAAIAECEVVLLAAALVRVTLDRDVAGQALDLVAVAAHGVALIRADVIAVEVEVDG